MVHEATRPSPPLNGQSPAAGVSCLDQRGTEALQARIDELMGILAHELRTPIAAILTAVGVLTDCDLDPPARRVLAGMERQVRQAMRLVDDLFDVCAGSWGKLSLCKVVVNLTEVVAGATGTTAHLFAARRHRLTVSLPPAT
jgi:signal transduction histidine kinase